MREPGFYWVRWEGIHQVAEWDQNDDSWLLSGWDVPQSEDKVEVLSERLQPPVPGLPEADTFWSLYKRLCKLSASIAVGGKVEIDGRLCKVVCRNPKPPKAKAAPKPAGAPAGRKRRPPPAR